jgi:mannose-6-phosphate isomerase class I
VGYSVDRISLEKKKGRVALEQNEKFSVLTVLEGEVTVSTIDVVEKLPATKHVRAGHSVFIPAFVRKFVLKGDAKKTVVLKCGVPD